MKVESPTSPALIFSPQALGSRPQSIRLGPGGVVQAVVLASSNRGRLLLQIEGQQVWARSSIQAQPGQVLTLEVQTLAPELVLRYVGPLQTDYESFLALCLKKGLSLMSWEALSRLLTGAREEMEQAGFTRPESPGVFQESSSPVQTSHWNIKELLRASGIFLEAKLREMALGKADPGPLLPDLKADLLRALHQAARSGNGEGSLRGMLEMLVGAQSLALVGQERDSLQLVASLPPWWMPKGSWGDLRIGRWVTGKEGLPKRGWSITLRMEMEDMGRILARVYLLGGLLGCELKASKEDVRESLREEIESLKQALCGIWPTSVECGVGSLDESLDWSLQELELPESLVGLMA